MPGRDNGFVARHYVPLADLDPRLADAMLEALRAEGIAAYVVPSTGSLGGYLEVHMPERPRDRLWVDREHHDRATTLLSAHSDQPEVVTPVAPAGPPGPAGPAEIPGLRDDSLAGPQADAATSADEVWAQLVAGFDLPSYEGAIPWPVAEDLPADADHPSRREPDGPPPLPLENPRGKAPTPVDPDDGHPIPPGPADSPVPRRIVRPVDRSFDVGTTNPADPAVGSDEYDPLSILDEHFVPDPPPPLPRLRRGTRWALASILVGVVLIVGRSLSDAFPGAVALGVLAIVGGFVGLVAMMREDRPSDSDPDDGAVV